ncbi:hypothetical protein [Komagataeibacter sp. FNDCF1]|uniref:hypothetical protein n=1 Tax=Komagataeibacter sp. FNDCF1 TaxID=2878681 RepID=UPI00351CE427
MRWVAWRQHAAVGADGGGDFTPGAAWWRGGGPYGGPTGGAGQRADGGPATAAGQSADQGAAARAKQAAANGALAGITGILARA